MDAGAGSNLAITEDDFLRLAADAAWPAFRRGGALSLEAASFLRGMYEDASVDELEGIDLKDLLALAHEFWLWRTARAPDEQMVRIRHGAGAGGRAIGRDILEAAGPDMPFLVDSVMGELADQGIAALAMFHPLVQGEAPAARESLIQIHLPPLTATRARALHEAVRATLADVRMAVSDYLPLKRRMLERADELSRAPVKASPEEAAESVALLRWLAADRFTFLGARDYQYARDQNGMLEAAEPIIVERSGLGLLRDDERYVLRSSAEPILISPQWRALLEEPAPLIVSKSTLRSRVHRRTAADYIGVKRYGADGEVIGETRFIGLFTTEAFTDPTRDIPMLRQKVAWVMREAGFAAGGHNAKSLRHILETYPREELWRTDPEELLNIARGILHLLDRPRPRAFVHRDRFNRFVSVLTYLPKDRFNSRLREVVGKCLTDAFGGEVDTYYPQLGEGPMARVHFIIDNIDPTRPAPDPAALDANIAALTRSWDDAFQSFLAASPAFEASAREQIARRFDHAFIGAYRERFTPQEALFDVAEILRGSADEIVRVRAYRSAGDAASAMRCKLYARGDVLALSATVPILENLGLYVESELNFELSLRAVDGVPAQTIFVHEIEVRTADGAEIDLEAVGEVFELAFAAIWSGRAENDGFNRLILKLGVGWREAALIRALARYRQQTGLDPSQPVQEQALAAHPEVAALILALFRVRFDPSLPETAEARLEWMAQIGARIEAALNQVSSLDEDRALRRIADLVRAILRTNYYQPGPDGGVKSYMSFKIASDELADLPLPKPYREIWVAAPQVEGVHLRFGPVARGGLRWSDRRDDFRAEVLDLVKAQQVKNAIIVPVGAKGGFYPKRLPPRGAPGYQEAGIEAYKTFLRGLLDITDNIIDDQVRPPHNVQRWDDDDPYLVVAADKGTATFSDIANAISLDYGHWLGDAFASGGSAGYDHKAMGITARGAWEAVKRHFREIGKNIQDEPFTVIGVGDMSGDVFGNGMLLSRKIRLIAAFDHRDIFLDPAPADLETAWAERKRLFEKPRSSWADYDPKLISAGGGVFSRSLKSIAISPEIAALTGLATPQVTPTELIHALLKSPCELLWFGGIGAYVKARAESHAVVSDKTNDALRVDAEDVRAQVIGEGANLGVTQAGRIAYARAGGRINTDAIDNSAGVDTSDHEVNIKILLTEAIRTGALKGEARDALLAEMTDEVAALVLKDNYDQTLALSLCEAAAAADLDSHERFMQRLEAAGALSRTVEGLPNAAEIASLRAAKLGMTRPELSKLMAYAKIDLFGALTASPAPDDPAFAATLKAYFPEQLARYEPQMARHRLRREIIATALADDVVNVGGPSFIDRVREIVRAEPVTIATSFEAARRIFSLGAVVDAINALDNHAPAAAQIALHREIGAALRRIVTYLARHAGALSIDETVARYKPAIEAQRAELWDTLSHTERARADALRAEFIAAGAPESLAREITLLRPLSSAPDIADMASACGWSPGASAYLYRAVGAAFGIDSLRGAAASLDLTEHWDRLAARRAGEDLSEAQRDIAQAAARAIGAPPPRADTAWAARATGDWIASLGALGEAPRAAIADLEGKGGWSFAKLVLAGAEVSGLAAALR